VALGVVDVGVGRGTQKGGACQQACDLDLFGIGQRPRVFDARLVSPMSDFVFADNGGAGAFAAYEHG